MKTALLTGKTGFIGRNVLPLLRERFHVLAPDRAELDLRDLESVRAYFQNHRVDLVFHLANPNPVKNSLDAQEKMAEDSLRLFLNLYLFRDRYEKMICIGSGAEYDKRKEIVNVSEEDCFRSPPADSYGLAKYTINRMVSQSENVYNLCLFGCYGPGDHASKFITHCIRCCLRGEPVTIRQDCRFDYIQVTDLGRILVWMGENRPQRHMYNVSGRQHAFLSEIAAEVCRQMDNKRPIQILKEGFNREYTADGKRFWQESGIPLPMSLQEGIAIQIKWEKERFQ